MKNKDEIIAGIREIIREAEHMKNAYFWDSPKTARQRRSYEKQHSHEEIFWHENGSDWSARYDVSCSCRNVYACGTYTRDGKKTTLTAIRNSYKRLCAC